MLIIDMTMPRTCAECPICQFDNECGDLYHRCGETLNLCEKPYEDRNEDCPIKGVLPEQHGRLVDADACSSVLRKLENEAKTNTEKLCYGYAARMFEEAFTIIAAERKDDEQIH